MATHKRKLDWGLAVDIVDSCRLVYHPVSYIAKEAADS